MITQIESNLCAVSGKPTMKSMLISSHFHSGIHDNFMYVQEVIKDLDKRKVPSLFIKLDIFKAFDTVKWSYLLHVMEHLGLSLRWRNWIPSLWCTSASSFLVSGVPSKKIFHCRGVRQGDPLSSMLFLLAMEPLHKLIAKAQQEGLLNSLSNRCDTFRMSLYADEATIFINPTHQDLKVAIHIMNIFVEASGLHTNLEKIECFLMQCDHLDLSLFSFRKHVHISFPLDLFGSSTALQETH
jgi:hypothetical protein